MRMGMAHVGLMQNPHYTYPPLPADGRSFSRRLNKIDCHYAADKNFFLLRDSGDDQWMSGIIEVA